MTGQTGVGPPFDGSKLLPPTAYSLRKLPSSYESSTLRDEEVASAIASCCTLSQGALTAIKKRKRQRGAQQMGKTKDLPERLQDEVPESALYAQLVEFEKKLDATIMRKKVDIHEAVKAPSKSKRLLRVFVSSKALYQDNAEDKEDEDISSKKHKGERDNINESESDEEEHKDSPCWTLKIEGRLFDDPNLTKQECNKTKKKFSAFFNRVFIELEERLYSKEDRTVEWIRSMHATEVDGFEVRRLGSKDTKAKVVLYLDHQPPLFKLGAPLARVLGIHTATRNEIVMRIWTYIKTHNLQDPSDHTAIVNDESFEKLFGTERTSLQQIPKLMMQYLTPPDPIVIEHTISMNEDDNDSYEMCYDIPVEVEDIQTKNALSGYNFFRMSPGDIGEMRELDNGISNIIREIKDRRELLNFMDGFADDPYQFIQKWIASQARDYKFAGDMPSNYEEERRAEYYYKPWTEESVWKYISEKTKQRLEELENTLKQIKTKQN